MTKARPQATIIGDLIGRVVLLLLAGLLWIPSLVLASDCLPGTWARTWGPDGGTVNAVVLDPGTTPHTAYAATDAGVFRRDGDSWHAINAGLTDLGVHSLAINTRVTPSVLYAGTDTGVFKWNGDTWRSVGSAPYFFSPSANALAVDGDAVPLKIYAGNGMGVFLWNGEKWMMIAGGSPPADVNEIALRRHGGRTSLYAGCWGSGVFIYEDNSWRDISAGLPSLLVGSLAFDETLTPPSLYAGTWEGVFRWDGFSWSPVNVGISFGNTIALALDSRTTPATLYAGTFNSGIYKWDGSAWSDLNAGLGDLDVWSLAFDSGSPSVLLAGTLGGVFQWTGEQWTSFSTGLGATWVHALAVDSTVVPSSLYAAPYGGGVMRWDGAAWNPLREGLGAQPVLSLLVDPTCNPAAIYAGDLYSFYKLDGGAWSALTEIPGPRLFSPALALDTRSCPPILFSATDEGSVFAWDGGGWTNIGPQEPAPDIYSMAVDTTVAPSVLYAASFGVGVFSYCAGQWTKLDSENVDLRSITNLALDTGVSPALVYAGTFNGMIYRWDGARWDAITDWSYADVLALAVDTRSRPSVLFAALDMGAGFLQWDGATSCPINSGFSGNPALCLAVDEGATPPRLYAGTAGSGVFVNPRVEPPVISAIVPAGNPYRLTLFGTNFHPSARVFLDGKPVPSTVYVSGSKLRAEGGPALKALLPKKTSVEITVKNTDDGGISAASPFSR
jgi:hypothetical protein